MRTDRATVARSPDRLRLRLAVPPGGVVADRRMPRIVALCDRDQRRLDRGRRADPGGPMLHRRGRAVRTGEVARLRRDLHAAGVAPRAGGPGGPAAGRTSSVRSRRRWSVRISLSMIDACTTAGVRLMIHENWRFRPWYRAMRAEIDSGSIGRPIRLRIAHHDTRALRPDGFAHQPYLADDAPTDPDGHGLPPGGHGALPDRGDPDRLGNDRPVRTADGRRGPGDAARSHSRSGALGSLDLSWCTAPDAIAPGMGAQPDGGRGNRRDACGSRPTDRSN